MPSKVHILYEVVPDLYSHEFRFIKDPVSIVKQNREISAFKTPFLDGIYRKSLTVRQMAIKL